MSATRDSAAADGRRHCARTGARAGHRPLGNYFNQELYGRATQLLWGLRIDAAHSPNGVAGTFQPTFLYESIWDVGTAAILLWADRRFTLGHGRVFGLYMIVYGAGRGWIEALRIDPAHHILGLRLDDWTSILVFTAGLIGFVVSARRHPGREIVVEPEAGREHRQPEAVLEAGSGRETAS